ncbi:MAG: MATE family efflux transporter [Cyanobacteriota bacterium]
MIDKEIAKTIYIVALPTMIHMLLESSYHFVDTFWIGMLGSDALAGATAASFFIWMIFSATALVEVGVNSLVARCYGAKDYEKMKQVSVQGARLGIMISIFISILGIFFIEDALKLMGVENIVIYNSILFIFPLFVGLPLFTLNLTNFATFRGSGDTKTPLIILLIQVISNVILAPIFIFYLNFGMAGAITATFVCQIVSFFIGVYFLQKKELIVPAKKIIDFEIWKEISLVGSPIALNGVIFCVVYLFLTKVVSQFGTPAIAALGLGHRVESISYCICVGFCIAATTLVGQSVGARDYVKAKKFAWTINLYAGSIILFISIVVFLSKSFLIGLFTSDPKIFEYTSQYLLVLIFIEVFMAFEVVMEGVFSGYGNTLPASIIGFPLNIARVPLAYFLASIYGVMGIWYAIGLTTILKGSLLLIWFYFSTITKKTSKNLI